MGIILIVEDEINIRTGLVKMVNTVNSSLEVYETGAAETALQVSKTQKVDAFFLDIQLEDYSGFELAKQIREMDVYKFTPIIFITAIHSRELEAFRNIHCYDYIIKPFSEKEVARVFQEVITHGIIEQKSEPLIRIKERGFTCILNQEDIIYIEAKNRKLMIKTIYEEAETSIYTMAKLSEQLSDQFIQCHKSYIVNCSFINRIDRINNVLYCKKNDTPIPIGRKYKEYVWRVGE